jgi:hypothetical protein
LIQLFELLQIIILDITKRKDKTDVGIMGELVHQLTVVPAHPPVILAVKHLVIVEDFHNLPGFSLCPFRFFKKIIVLSQLWQIALFQIVT